MVVIGGRAEIVADAPRYARFLRRLRGVAIDFMLFTVAMVVALHVAIALGSNELARVIGFAFIAGFLLYEPLLVSFAGGTVGHYLSNLRVVDNRTDGNLSFLKAVTRAILKAVLGWYSFITMLAARRHQAVHDLLTRSTVQIRDPAKARPSDYAREQIEPSSPDMPARWRRLLIIVIHVITSLAVLVLAAEALFAAGAFSRACLNHNYCSRGENLLMGALGLVWLIGIALCIGLGWRGLLWGARRRAGTA